MMEHVARDIGNSLKSMTQRANQQVRADEEVRGGWLVFWMKRNKDKQGSHGEELVFHL